MKLELKKVTFSESLSEETNAFTADVYLNEQLVATARSRGNGGGTEIQPYAKPRPGNDPKQVAEIKANRAVMAQYEAWAAQQPKTEVGKHEWALEGFARSLEADIDTTFEAWLVEHYAQKDLARLKRMCKTKWVFSLIEQNGKPTDPNAIFTLARLPNHTIAAVGQHLRTKYGANLKEFLNEIHG